VPSSHPSLGFFLSFFLSEEEEGTFGEWLDGLPFEVAAATARLPAQALHARSGRGSRDHVTPGSPRPSQTGPAAGALAATATRGSHSSPRTAHQTCLNRRMRLAHLKSQNPREEKGLHQSSLPNAAKGYPPREPREELHSAWCEDCPACSLRTNERGAGGVLQHWLAPDGEGGSVCVDHLLRGVCLPLSQKER